jgi:hypothetical protein
MPDDDPRLTCTHMDAGLCAECQGDYDEDPSAWLEYGRHPEGERNWRALREEMAADSAKANTAVVASSDLAANRLDAGYNILRRQLKPILTELEKFTLKELLLLARKLPDCRPAAEVVLAPSVHSRSRKDFTGWLADLEEQAELGDAVPLSKRRYARDALSVYIAAAADQAIAKVMTELLELAERKRALIKDNTELLALARRRGAKTLADAMSGKLPRDAPEDLGRRFAWMNLPMVEPDASREE